MLQHKERCRRRNQKKPGKELGKQDREVNNTREQRKIIEGEAMDTIKQEWVCKE